MEISQSFAHGQGFMIETYIIRPHPPPVQRTGSRRGLQPHLVCRVEAWLVWLGAVAVAQEVHSHHTRPEQWGEQAHTHTHTHTHSRSRDQPHRLRPRSLMQFCPKTTMVQKVLMANVHNYYVLMALLHGQKLRVS